MVRLSLEEWGLGGNERAFVSLLISESAHFLMKTHLNLLILSRLRFSLRDFSAQDGPDTIWALGPI